MGSGTSSTLSLSDFVSLNARCETCSLPQELLAEIRNARQIDSKRFSFSAISKWLETKGSVVSEDSLRRHFKNHGARA